MKSRRLLVVSLAAIVGIGAVVSSCAPAENSDVITLGLTLEPVNLDISGTAGQAIPQVLLDNVYEGLVRVDDDGSIVPALASDYIVSDDGLTYDFTLREATFHNGESLTVDDVVWSLERVLDDKSTVVLPTQLAQFARVAEVASTADNQVRLTLTERDNDLLYSLTQRGGVIFKKGTTDFANTANGTGPFTLAQWDKGSSITLERYADYWGRRADTASVVFRYFADAAALSNALLAGDIDVMTTVQSPESLSAYDSRDDLRVQSGTTNCEVTLGMNNSRAPFNDVRVRTAVRQALDKDALIEAAWAGYLLAEAGVATGTEVSLDVPPIAYATNSSEFIAAALGEVGLDVTITPVTWEEWLDRVFTKADYDLTIVCHIERNDMAIYANPDYYFRFDNAEYQGFIAAAASSPTATERSDNLRKAARLLTEQSASDWLWLIPNLQVAKRDVAGVPRNSVGDSYFAARLERV
ncbi:MAG: ABC transporter substrate-binding protein [Actinobacteria bacterium]|nr:ABC transporter substrate-binding protein [Actinomycetota bacterium]